MNGTEIKTSLILRINYCIIMAMNTPKFYLVCKKHRIKTVVSNTVANFRFSPCILTFNHFYYPTNALNYIKLRD